MNASSGVIAAFSEEQTERLTGISKGRLRYWDRTNFYRPGYAEENRRIAYSRAYSFRDIVALRVLYTLRVQYRTSLPHLRDVRDRLEHLGSDPDRWTKVRLYPLNRRVVWFEEGSALPTEITSGQYIVAIVLDDVVQDTKNAVKDLRMERDKSKIGSIARNRFVLHNAPVIAGTRIPVSAIKNFHAAGYSTERILKEYPDLTERDISAALEYREASSAA